MACTVDVSDVLGDDVTCDVDGSDVVGDDVTCAVDRSDVLGDDVTCAVDGSDVVGDDVTCSVDGSDVVGDDGAGSAGSSCRLSVSRPRPPRHKQPVPNQVSCHHALYAMNFQFSPNVDFKIRCQGLFYDYEKSVEYSLCNARAHVSAAMTRTLGVLC